MEKNSKINQILMRPTHSRQEISNQDKNKLKELEGNNPELLMPQQNNELFNFNNKENNNISEINNEEEKLGTDITELIKEFPKENGEDVLENNLTEENIKYVDQEGYEFEYVNNGEYDDNESVYSDEDGNLIRYIDKGYKNKSKKNLKKNKKKNNKINYKYFIIYSLIVLLIIILIKNYRLKI